MIKGSLRSVVRRLPGARLILLRARFGDLRRTAPLTSWGEERGLPVDRWYIESYLSDHSVFVRGRVLEVKGDQYASRFGASAVDIVDIDGGNTNANVVGDLCTASTLETGRYDAAIVTQTIQFVADPAAALLNLFNSLKSSGALIVTVPCLSRLCGPSDRWRWTPAGFEQLLRAALPKSAHIELLGLGNGLAARAFLFGLAAEDLTPTALAFQDLDYPVVIGACVRPQR